MSLRYAAAVFYLACLPALAESSSSAPLIISAPIPAQSKPDNRVHFADYMGYAGIATYRALDYQSTRRGLGMGLKEGTLPQAIVESSGRLAAYECGIAAVEVGASVWMVHHGHRKIARAENWISVGLGAATVAHNYSVEAR